MLNKLDKEAMNTIWFVASYTIICSIRWQMAVKDTKIQAEIMLWVLICFLLLEINLKYPQLLY